VPLGGEVETTVNQPADHAVAAGISLQGVTKRFGSHAAVDGVDLEIARSEFFTMLGPSGSGKTTLLRLIAGFEVPDAGTISLHGREVTGLPPYLRGVNTVFQDYALFPHLSVLDNVAYGLRVRRVRKSARRAKAREALAITHMSEFETRRPGQLSGGQRQRVALARAIVNEPEVLLLDEPLGALDLKLRQGMQVELKRIQRQLGITFIYVTHDQEEALTMSDRLAVFKDGRIEQIGAPADVYENPRTEFVATFVGTSNVLESPVGRAVLRPERIGIDVANVPSGFDSLTGTVIDVAYLGIMTRVTVEANDGRTMSAVSQNRSGANTAASFALKSTVTLSWDPADAVAIGAGESSSTVPNKGES